MSNEIMPYEQPKEINMNLINHLCDIAVKSKCYQNLTKDQILHLYVTAHDLGIPYSKAINGGFDVIQGNLRMKPALMGDMIRRCGHSLRIKFNGGESCTILGTRKDNGDTLEITYTYKQAEKAGLTGKDTWKKYPEDMLYATVMRKVGRMLFPDVIGNAYTPDEIEEIMASKKLDSDTCKTIEVQNNIPMLEEKPKEIVIPVETLHLAMDVLGFKCEIENVKEYIFHVSEERKKSQEFIIQQVMKSDENIQAFYGKFELWKASKTS